MAAAQLPPASCEPPCLDVVPVQDEGRIAAKCKREGIVENLLLYGPPEVATGVAIFGLGIAALPLLERFHQDPNSFIGGESAKADQAFSYAPYASNGADCTDKLFQLEELCARLGPLDPTSVAAELQLDVDGVVGRSSSDNLKTEVEELQGWSDKTEAVLALLERRSAFAFLGLGMDANPHDVHRSYKRKALDAHPDKGGSEEDFLNLQSMVVRLHDDDVWDDSDKKGSNLFANLKELMKQAKEKKAEEPFQEISVEMKLKQKRMALHDAVTKAWARAQVAQQQLFQTSSSSVSKPTTEPFLAQLRKLVQDFSTDIESLSRGAGGVLAAERILCKLVRRGMDVLSAAALVNATETVAHIALNFTAPLLKAAQAFGPCLRLEQRCKLLLSALGDVSTKFKHFVDGVKEGLDNKSASEWRGCNESISPAVVIARKTAQPEDAVDSRSEAPSKDTGVQETDMQGPAAFQPAGPAIVKPVESAPFEQCTELDLPPEQSLKVQINYTDTKEWRHIRGLCVRGRICVDFNRDNSDERCVDPDCRFRHKCALCGAMLQGSKRFQHKYHGAWNCPLLLGFVAELQSK